ncbi:NTP transferase domain-containing protein [Ochrobactrum cytisi]|nr:NTP transferase domain-containing protein [Brucella cytisi]
MEKASDIAVVVLGAGAGKRFGSGDKLNQKLADKPVAHHILGSLAPFQWGRKILVHHGKAPRTMHSSPMVSCWRLSPSFSGHVGVDTQWPDTSDI